MIMKKSHSVIIGLLVGVILTIPFLPIQHQQQKPNMLKKNQKSVKAASSASVSINANPTSNLNAALGTQLNTLRMQTNGNDISAYDIYIKSSDPSVLQIDRFVSSSDPIPGFTGQFLLLKSEKLDNGQTYHFIGVNPTNNVFTGDNSNILSLGTLYANLIKQGQARLTLDPRSTVTGRITGELSVSNAGGVLVDIAVPTATPVAPTATPVPAVAPTITSVPLNPTSAETYVPPAAPTATTAPAAPTATGTPVCAPKSQGNASLDCVIDTQDFDIWSREARREVGTTNADFNGDGKVDILDFNIWRIGLFNINATRKR